MRSWINQVPLVRRLSFEPEAEALFRRDYHEATVVTTRVALVSGLFLYAMFGVLDSWSAPVTREFCWLIRYAIVCPLIVVGLGATFAFAFWRHSQLVFFVLIAAAGLGIVVMIGAMHPEEDAYGPYYAGLILVLMYCPFIRVRFPCALLVNTILVVSYAGMLLFGKRVLQSPEGIVLFVNNTFFLVAAHVISTAVCYWLDLHARQLFRQRQDIDAERGRAQRLLLNILPAEVAERLKTAGAGEIIASLHSEVSILFADVVGFTPLASRVQPETVVRFLDELFAGLDALVAARGLEKIKTIGDCYMAAAGVPRARADHALVLTQVAMEMMDWVEGHALAGNRCQLRIGISSGPVVAGVIGRQKFAYDLWGDTVNMASRMESHGIPGRIQITRATHERIASHIHCEYRGQIPVKGIGLLETWLVATGSGAPASGAGDRASAPSDRGDGGGL